MRVVGFFIDSLPAFDGSLEEKVVLMNVAQTADWTSTLLSGEGKFDLLEELIS